MLTPQQATSRINVKRLMLAKTGRYDAQVSRPYQTNLQQNTLNLLMDRVGGSTRFTGSQLAGIASQIVSPSAQFEGGVNIAGVPWNENRMRFMMEVECRALAGGASTTIMVLGYTNHPGVTIQGAVDPRMEFYVNSVISVRATPEHTPQGVRMHTAITDNSHVLVNPSYAGAYGNVQAYKMRPEDVYAAMKLTAITPIQDVLDIRTIMDTKPVASKRSNTIATDYAAGLLDGYSRASLDQNLGVHKEEDILENARGYAQENLVQNNPFFRAIQNYRDGFMTNWFSWSDLNKLDPNVDNVTVITMPGQTNQVTSNPVETYDVSSGTAAPWTGSDRMTHVATILSQSVPALMTEFGLTTVGFVSTNRRIFADAVEGSGPFSAANRINTRITDMLSFADFDMAPYMPHFVSRLEQLVMMDISFNNEMDFFIDMHADLIGESWIKVSLDGQPLILYVTPSFADALMVPVVTNAAGRASQLSHDFEAIFHEVANHAGIGHNIGGPGAVQQPQMAAPENLFGRI